MLLPQMDDILCNQSSTAQVLKEPLYCAGSNTYLKVLKEQLQCDSYVYCFSGSLA